MTSFSQPAPSSCSINRPISRWQALLQACMPLVLLLLLFTSAAAADPIYPGEDWGHVPPAQARDFETRLADARAYSETLGSTAVMVIQHGLVLAEWGDVAHKSNLHSVRKSLLSALVGIAVSEGKMNLDDTLKKLRIDDVEPSLTPVEKTATLRDLIKARSGIYHPTVYETAAMKEKKPARGAHAPGTFWYYNNWDFNALGTIYEAAVGKSIFEAFEQKIAQPVGMQDYKPTDGSYFRGGETLHPAYPINMTARDLARFALLYLREGRWNGRQIIPAQWVKDSAKPYSDTGSGGYGYLWWTSDSPTREGSLPPGVYWAAGNHGQYAMIIPSLDLVVVHRLDFDQVKRGVSRGDVIELTERIIRALKDTKGGS